MPGQLVSSILQGKKLSTRKKIKKKLSARKSDCHKTFCVLAYLSQWFPTRGIFFFFSYMALEREYLAISEDIFDCNDWGERKRYRHSAGYARGAPEHPMMHRKAPQNKELSCPKC